MKASDAIHGGYVHPRRVRVLAAHAARLLPAGAHVLDVGTGDGRLAAMLATNRPDLRIEGIDVLVRRETAIPVTRFDGATIPFPSRSVDAVSMFDVLHHADDPVGLLAEAARVARSCLIVKDHICDGGLARSILRFMDHVSNRRHGVALPNNYLSSSDWSAAIDRLDLRRGAWEVGGLALYPWPASMIFGGTLHVMARLDISGPRP